MLSLARSPVDLLPPLISLAILLDPDPGVFLFCESDSDLGPLTPPEVLGINEYPGIDDMEAAKPAMIPPPALPQALPGLTHPVLLLPAGGEREQLAPNDRSSKSRNGKASSLWLSVRTGLPPTVQKTDLYLELPLTPAMPWSRPGSRWPPAAGDRRALQGQDPTLRLS